MQRIMPLLITLFICNFARAGSLTVASDIAQPIFASGWNVNAYYIFENKLILSWSHGADLKINPGDEIASDEIEDQNVELKVNYTTGPEVGYSFSDIFDVRLDFKIHQADFKFRSNGEKTDYELYTVGPAVTYHWYPFSDNKGFVVNTSARYWFYAGDTLSGGDFKYIDSNGQTQKHDPEKTAQGSATGLGFNISLGWTF